MSTKTIWNNLSVKHKLFGLVLLPISLLLFLAGRQALFLTEQLHDFERTNKLAVYLQDISILYRSTLAPDPTSFVSQSAQAKEELKALSPVIFREQSNEVNQLLSDFSEATLSTMEATDSFDKLDAIEWQSDLYKQLLLSIERVPFEVTKREIQQHLNALQQLEWLSFWSNEEFKLSASLLDIFQNQQEYDPELAEQIKTLGERQLLFLERFITLNANENQVAQMVEVFRNEVFIQSQEIRSALFSAESINQLSSDEINTGLAAMSARLNLLQELSNVIKQEFQSEVELAISNAEMQRTLFIGLVTLLAAVVMGLTISLARQVTNNLGLILKFLKSEDGRQRPSLSKLVQGKDELSLFAQQVERLTIEREHAKERLTLAKEDAEKAKDNAIQASKAKSSFLANMSHEIRTPLNGVIGISEILSDTQLTPTQRDYVDTIDTSSHLLLSLINDILDFSKIESGMLLISPHSASIRESIYDIASIVAPKAKEQKIALNVNISPNTPSRVMIDDHRLRQVLMNFMSNAVKFTTEGAVTLSINTLSDVNSVNQNTPNAEESHTHSVKVRFSVQDTGIGIDEKQQKQIFEPFAQEDDSTTRQFGGTGLGLAISTQLVELMGGKIQLDSVKGKGSCFYFDLELPVDVNEAKASTVTSNIILISNNQHLTQRIEQDLEFYSLTLSKASNAASELPALLETVDKAKPTTVIFAEDEQLQASDHKAILDDASGQGVKVCLIRSFLSDPVDLGPSITAQVSQPLLGLRFIKALEHCDSQGQAERSENQTLKQCASQVILIVEDNKINQKIAGLHVGKSGYTFKFASNGQEAVDMYTANPHYAAILMDCMMPVMDGFEATANIRRIEQEINSPRRIPIIALTASVIDDDIQRCFDVGMDDYIPKPFKFEMLKEKVISAVEASAPIPLTQQLQSETNSATVTPINSAKESETKEHVQPAAQTSAPITSTPNASTPQPTFTPKEEVENIVAKSERILLVEDNRVNQKVASVMLKKAGYAYEIADNGQIAVDMYRKDNSYDVILMDCMMPVKDGFTATREIREHEQSFGLNKTPIIALTASVIDDDIQKCYDSGMDGYVAKPVRKDKLFHQIESATS
ncbi:response regulator [Vibrio sp. THAF190c]|uniref:response regulator n=1 Tax=Vibrio sp. THAF190c TaxID=2587865 RepID=UPI00126812B1|nr:response regulator [Vibrio sp. THAF190c]QFT12581.1 Signal transduction histidine-protein kinase BarA [Vibrio sp. THAF190c]